MIFKIMIHVIWKYFDVICFILAMIVADYGAFLFGKKIGVIGVAITIALIGWMAEVIANKET